MRRFVIGTIVGAGLMYFYLFEYGAWKNWASGRANTVSSQYGGDSHRNQAEQALH